MYSQDYEEQVIADFFGSRVGRFLDVGAHDGRTFSNTLRLVEQGWSGVCVEPAASVFGALLATHRDRPAVKLVNAALAPQRGILPFWDCNGDCVGTTDTRHRDLWAGDGVRFSETWIQTLSVPDFLVAFPGPYQFVSLDVEGATFDLLRSLPLDALGVELLCVEWDQNASAQEIEEHCRQRGFSTFHVVGCNLMVSR